MRAQKETAIYDEDGKRAQVYWNDDGDKLMQYRTVVAGLPLHVSYRPPAFGPLK